MVLAGTGPNPSLDAPSILGVLGKTTPGQASAKPSQLEDLKSGLQRLRSEAVRSIPDRTQSVTVDLVCWMEMRRG